MSPETGVLPITEATSAFVGAEESFATLVMTKVAEPAEPVEPAAPVSPFAPSDTTTYVCVSNKLLNPESRYALILTILAFVVGVYVILDAEFSVFVKQMLHHQ